MNKEIKKLLEKAINSDMDGQDLLVDLGRIFEKNNLKRSSSIPDQVLPDRLKSIKLSREEKIEIIEYLIINLKPGSSEFSTMLWAIGKADIDIITHYSIDLAKKYLLKFNDEEIYQLIILLQDVVIYGDKFTEKEVKEIIYIKSTKN